MLEAIHFASLGRSQRAVKEADLIRWEQTQAFIHLSFEKLGVEQTVAFELQVNKPRRIILNDHPIKIKQLIGRFNTVLFAPEDLFLIKGSPVNRQKLGVEQSIAFELSRDKPRRIILNDQPIKIKQLIGKFNTVLFAPEDLFLIKGSPVNRRKFLDAEISQASPVYFADLLTYNKILTQRNSLLKLIKDGQAKPDSLALWNEQITNAAVKIIEKRIDSIKKISQLANELQQKISAQLENLSIVYELHGVEDIESVKSDISAWYQKKMSDKQQLDIIRGSTSFGPHIDDIKFLINGRDLRSFGSQGQQRTAVLALKLSELEFLREETGSYPILLLDDVMSELDEQRRSQLLDFLNRQHIQTFITATDSAYFPKDSIADYFNVNSGKISLR